LEFVGRFADRNLLLHIYDLTGRLVKSFLFNHLTTQPFNQIAWDGTDERGKPVPGGIYFCELNVRANEKTATRKLVMVR
jgi:flagellar hook assembly protein FlgD